MNAPAAPPPPPPAAWRRADRALEQAMDFASQTGILMGAVVAVVLAQAVGTALDPQVVVAVPGARAATGAALAHGAGQLTAVTVRLAHPTLLDRLLLPLPLAMAVAAVGLMVASSWRLGRQAPQDRFRAPGRAPRLLPSQLLVVVAMLAQTTGLPLYFRYAHHLDARFDFVWAALVGAATALLGGGQLLLRGAGLRLEQELEAVV